MRTARFKPVAVILPHNKKLIVWVTSPNGYWMLLSGHWSVASEARRYVMAAGYTLTSQEKALKAIEIQMAERMAEIDGNPFAHDVVRETKQRMVN